MMPTTSTVDASNTLGEPRMLLDVVINNLGLDGLGRFDHCTPTLQIRDKILNTVGML